MDPILLAEGFERWVSILIAITAGTLAIVSFAAWRRERAWRMLVVGIGYALFMTFGLLVALERSITRLFSFASAELIEHGASVLVLAGLLVFFLAISRE